jgi:tRNA/rRNA methyltransferase/tRNA (cytidine32/uridine32-2'-O)-methyltransferase
MNLSDPVIILCRPGEAGNVGAVCRAMKNMGLRRLRLVKPAPLDDGVVRIRAVHAEPVWEEAVTFETLTDAIADLSLVIGVTRRRGQHRKSITLTPEETAAFLRKHPGPAALVFGNERTGLDAEELNLCNLASHIPSDEDCPSLNLSHAVQIYAYQLFRAFAQPPGEGSRESGFGPGPSLNSRPTAKPVLGAWNPLDRSSVDSLVKSVTDSLASLGFYKQPGREDQERFFRDVFSRAGLSKREAQYLEEIFSKAAGLAKKAGG